MDTLAFPDAFALEGEPVRTVPEAALSSLNVIPSFAAKPPSVPVKVVEPPPPPLKSPRPKVVFVNARLELAVVIVTEVLLALSPPCQNVPLSGTIAYFQLPAGTFCSLQLVATTVPWQLAPIVWATFEIA